MIKYQLFDLQAPKYEYGLAAVNEKINEFFANRPNFKIINIEHVVIPQNADFGCFSRVCVWYSVE